MAEEIAFENGFPTLKGLWPWLHTFVHHLSTSTYMPNFNEIEETFYGRTDGHLRPTLLDRLRRVDLKMQLINLRCT